jgi:membrane protease YdiL (CAAX protease family)
MTQSPTRVNSIVTAIGLTYGSVLIGALVVLTATSILDGFGISTTSRPSLELVLGTVLYQGVTLGGIAILYLKISEHGLEFVPFSIPNKRDSAVIVVGIVTLLGLLLAASAILSVLGIESAQNQIETTGQQNPTAFLLLIPLSFLLVGPGEELLYRGLVQGILRETLHPAAAIILASALFASIHLFSLTGEGKFVYLGIAFVLATVLGASYEYTENLTVPAMIHGAYNAIQFAVSYLTATGGV